MLAKVRLFLPLFLLASSLATLDPPDRAAALPQSNGDTSGQSVVIRVNSNLVVVPVSVTDAQGNIVGDLKREDFRLEEDGRTEPIIKVAEPGETPLDLTILLDISASVQPRFEFERQAAADFLRKVLRPGDTVAVISIGHEPVQIQPRTEDSQRAIDSILKLPGARGSTAFFDAVREAAQLLRRSAEPERRRVQVAMSDGEDNNSVRRLPEVQREVQQADCIFYSINPAGPSIRLNKTSMSGQRAMEMIATQTGGSAFVPDGIGELEIVFERIANELRAQYVLEYYSSDQRRNGTFRQIVVRIPGRPDLRVRARQGYYPS
jgi:Ca-activated chloride channel family protein